MYLFLYLSIVLGLILILLLGARFFELKRGKYFLSPDVRFKGDKRIKEFILAILKIIVRIKKFLIKETLLLPKRILGISYFIWLKIKGKIDSFYNRINRKY